MDLSAPLPETLYVRGYAEPIQKEVVLGIYELLYDLLDPNDEQRSTNAKVFVELVYCSQDPERRVTDDDVLQFVTSSPLISVYDDGRLYIQHTIRAIILASTEKAEVGFRLLRLQDVIEIR